MGARRWESTGVFRTTESTTFSCIPWFVSACSQHLVVFLLLLVSNSLGPSWAPCIFRCSPHFLTDLFGVAQRDARCREGRGIPSES